MNTQAALDFALDNELDYTRLAADLMRQDPQEFFKLVKVDLDKLASDLLKSNPELFLKLGQEQITGVTKIAEINAFIKVGHLVSAIKALREDTGLGLKEAKDIIVSARDALQAKGLYTVGLPPAGAPMAVASPPLSVKHMAMCNALVDAFV